MWQQTISQSPDSAPGSERRIDLDWVRIAAFGLLIFYHVGMLYVSWGFHIKSAHRIAALEPVMLVLNPWRLALLFLVSGVATRFMLGKYTLAPLLRSRSARLLIPLVFGMLVIVPPQAYDQIVEALGYPAGFVDFYQRHYLAFGSQFCPNPCIVLPTWNHLWFVVYLWVYTVALGGVLWLAPGLARLDRAAAGIGAVGRAAAGRAAAAACGLSSGAAADTFHRRTRCSATGTITRCSRPSSCSASCWPARTPSGRRWSACAGWRCRSRPGSFCAFSPCGRRRYGGMPLKILAGLAYGSYQWLCMVALLGFARRWLTADSAGAALSHRCDLPVLHRAPDRDHHDCACAARTAACRPGLRRAIVIARHRRGLRGDL